MPVAERSNLGGVVTRDHDDAADGAMCVQQPFELLVACVGVSMRVARRRDERGVVERVRQDDIVAAQTQPGDRAHRQCGSGANARLRPLTMNATMNSAAETSTIDGPVAMFLK